MAEVGLIFIRYKKPPLGGLWSLRSVAYEISISLV
jgi:hypothetical protein